MLAVGHAGTNSDGDGGGTGIGMLAIMLIRV